MLDLLAELVSVTQELDNAAIPYALVGGLAYSIYVEARATEDIDLLVSADAWARIPELLSAFGYRSLAVPMDFEKIRIRRLTKICDGDVIVLDFLLADGPLAKGLERRVSIPFRNTSLWLAPPDVIIALKESRMSDKDKSDIAGLKKLLEDEPQ